MRMDVLASSSHSPGGVRSSCRRPSSRGRRRDPGDLWRGVAGVLALAALYAFVAALLPLADAFGQETITNLAPIAMSTTTGEKPQSKVWRHDGRWWAVLASDGVSPSGTWLWRLESNNQWTNV